MSAQRIYLDHNATTPLLPEARAAMIDVLDLVGNASSVHAEGRKARALIEGARRDVAGLVGAQATQVVFTGSATEAITQAIIGAVRVLGVTRIVVSAAEHAAVSSAAALANVEVIQVGLNADGQIDLAALGELVADNTPTLFALHWVNGETGVVQPLDAIAAKVGPTPHYLFVDGVQGAGKLPIEFASSVIDMLALSAHKIGGPQGVGALIMKAHCDQIRLIPGGGQEKGRRGGTENVAGVVGFGAAASHIEKLLSDTQCAALLTEFELGLMDRFPDAAIFGQAMTRNGVTSNFALPGITSAVALMKLDLAGYALSNGSACSSGKVKRSHVLEAMGVAPDTADCALRISLGWNTNINELNQLLTTLTDLFGQQKRGEQVA